MNKEQEIKVKGVDLGEAVIGEVTVPAETKTKKSFKDYAKDALLVGAGFLGGTIFGYQLGKSKAECECLGKEPTESPQQEQPRGEVVEVRLPQRNGGFHHRKFNNENNQ